MHACDYVVKLNYVKLEINVVCVMRIYLFRPFVSLAKYVVTALQNEGSTTVKNKTFEKSLRPLELIIARINVLHALLNMSAPQSRTDKN